MNTNLESILEQELVQKLVSLGYEKVNIKNEKDLNDNFKLQLEKLNKINLTDKEFEKILNCLDKGNIFNKSYNIRHDNPFIEREGKKIKIKLFDKSHYNENNFQVANQISITNQTKSRFDVTILINGLPLVQIELKKRDVELSQAFNQINKYKIHSFTKLFKYIQIFIISNGQQTRYFSTNDNDENKSDFKFAFTWSNEKNNKINDLLKNKNNKLSFADSFLSRCHLHKMIFDYMIIQPKTKEIKILRPYQFYAIKSIIDHIDKGNGNGYIWHTTGSGKTLTSFKAANILKSHEKIDKVFFVVDRVDLNSQTTSEFRNFGFEDDILDIESTKQLINKIKNKEKHKIIVTTIQKFSKAIKYLESKQEKEEKERISNSKNWSEIRNQRILIIFDECHRSQNGDQNKSIREYFTNSRFIGFTGTPLFSDNADGIKTTKSIFNNRLHTYTIKEAIDDQNVLGFKIDYIKTFDKKENEEIELIFKDDVTDNQFLNKGEIFESEDRIKLVVNYILRIHNKKTLNRKYNALFSVNNIKTLIKYYNEFEKQLAFETKEEKKLKIGAIFSLQQNDENTDEKIPQNELEKIISKFNKTYKIKDSFNKDQWFNIYRNNLISKMKTENINERLDITIVVNMLTTGFDSKILNTLYSDKNLKYHNLLQTFSRTNRIIDKSKTNGNIVSFRLIKKDVDEAIALFSNGSNINDVISINKYEEQLELFNQKINILKFKYKNVDVVNSLNSVSEELEFIVEFRSIASLMNLLKQYTEFDDKKLSITREEYNEYSTAYKSIYHKNKKLNDETSILGGIDFSIELLHTDLINSTYIEAILNTINKEYKIFDTYVAKIEDLIESVKGSNFNQSIINLIEKFMKNQLEKMRDILSNDNNKLEESDFVTYEGLKEYVYKYTSKELEKIIDEYNLKSNVMQKVFNEYSSTNELNWKTNLFIFNDKRNYWDQWEILEEIEDKIVNIYEISKSI